MHNKALDDKFDELWAYGWMLHSHELSDGGGLFDREYEEYYFVRYIGYLALSPDELCESAESINIYEASDGKWFFSTNAEYDFSSNELRIIAEIMELLEEKEEE